MEAMLKEMALNSDDLPSIPDYFHVWFENVFNDRPWRLDEIAKEGSKLLPEEFHKLRLVDADKNLKARTIALIKFYGKYPDVLKAFEKAYYYPIFNNGSDFKSNNFNISFLIKLVSTFPAEFISVLTKNLTSRMAENKEIMAKFLGLIKDDPFISVVATNGLDPNLSLCKFPGVRFLSFSYNFFLNSNIVVEAYLFPRKISIYCFLCWLD